MHVSRSRNFLKIPSEFVCLSFSRDPVQSSVDVEAGKYSSVHIPTYFSFARFPTDNDLLRQRSERYIDDVEWMRPSDIVRPEDPVLVSDRNEGFDIRTR